MNCCGRPNRRGDLRNASFISIAFWHLENAFCRHRARTLWPKIIQLHKLIDTLCCLLQVDLLGNCGRLKKNKKKVLHPRYWKSTLAPFSPYLTSPQQKSEQKFHRVFLKLQLLIVVSIFCMSNECVGVLPQLSSHCLIIPESMKHHWKHNVTKTL